MQGWRTREPKTPPAIRGPGVISCAPASSNNRLEPAWGSLCTSSQSCPARLPDKAGPPPAAGCSFTGAALGGSRHVEVAFKRGLWSSTGQHCQELVGVAMLRLAGCQAHRYNMERRRFFRRPNSHSPAGSASHATVAVTAQSRKRQPAQWWLQIGGALHVVGLWASNCGEACSAETVDAPPTLGCAVTSRG